MANWKARAITYFTQLFCRHKRETYGYYGWRKMYIICLDCNKKLRLDDGPQEWDDVK